jgi:hypothetical protein
MTYPDLAMVIPVWFAEAVPQATVRDRLLQTLEGVGQYVAPGKVVIVTDGDDRSAEVLSSFLPEFKRRYGHPFRLLVNEENGGKGSALTSGLRTLLREEEFSYALIRDGDGDHYVGDVEHLYRYMQWMRRQGVRGELVVVGRRADIHRSIGWIRGEFEELLNRLTMAALTHRLAAEGRVLDLRFLSAYPEPPDLMSGYKLCSHGICRVMAERNWQEGLPVTAVDLYRYGMEQIPLVEGGLEGAAIGEVLRLVGDDEKVSGHGRYTEPSVNAGLALWVLRRLDIAPDAAVSILENAIARSRLHTDPVGVSLLEAFCELLCQGFQTYWQAPISRKPDLVQLGLL